MPTVSTTALEIANAALLELGIRAITAFTDNTQTARTVNAIYENVKEEALGGYPWRFARGQIRLLRCATAPVPWESAYDIDGDVLNIITVYEGDQKVMFERMGAQIVTMTSENSTDDMHAEVTLNVAEDEWPAYFRQAFVQHLAAALAMPLTKDDKLRQIYEQAAFRRLQIAKSRDAQGNTPPMIDTKTFIRARRTNGRLSGAKRFVSQ